MNLSKLLVDKDNELHQVRRELEELKIKESDLINDIQSIEDALKLRQ